MIVLQLLRNDVKPLQLDDKLYTAQTLMDDYKVSHVPVFDGELYAGLLSEGEVLDAPDDDAPISVAQDKLVRAFVSAEKHVFEAINAFHNYNVSMLPVLDADEHYMGYLYPLDLVKMMGGMLSSKVPGAVLVLEMNQNDYHLSQIAQIVEGNDGKILAFYITSKPNSAILELTLRINRTDLTAIIQTFQRYEYNIKASYHESEYAVDMKARFENFIKYLNM
jgi:predicted transcriptional regulator